MLFLNCPKLSPYIYIIYNSTYLSSGDRLRLLAAESRRGGPAVSHEGEMVRRCYLAPQLRTYRCYLAPQLRSYILTLVVSAVTQVFADNVSRVKRLVARVVTSIGNNSWDQVRGHNR